MTMKYSDFRLRATIAFTLHFLIQFFAWALADSSEGTKIPWGILSFPLFYALKSWTTLYFWMVGVFNSALWGLAIGFSAYAIPRRRESL